ncbi:MAG: hypothetical protein PV358_05610 [Acidimicrobiales bacterium]|nr:hypothetical protein [Acidimicrobiales bacterium]
MQDCVITVAGEMDDVLRSEFEDCEVVTRHGMTQIRLAGVDAAVVHGVLHRVEVLGLELLEARMSGGDAPL